MRRCGNLLTKLLSINSCRLTDLGLRSCAALLVAGMLFAGPSALPVVAQVTIQKPVFKLQPIPQPNLTSRRQVLPDYPRYRRCNQRDLKVTTNTSSAGFLQSYADITAFRMNCIHENSAGSAPFFDKSSVDLFQKKFKELNQAIKRSMEKLGGRGKPSLKKILDYGTYLNNEHTNITLLTSYAICKVAEKNAPPGSGDFGCGTKRLKETAADLEVSARKHYDWVKDRVRPLKPAPYRGLPNVASIGELIAFLKARKYDSIKLGYALGDITLSSRQQKSKRIALQQAVVDQRQLIDVDLRYLDLLRSEIKTARSEFQVVAEREQRRLAPFAERAKALALKAATVTPPVRAADDKVRAMQRALERVNGYERRIRQLDAAIANLEDQLTRTDLEAIRVQLGHLKSERKGQVRFLRFAKALKKRNEPKKAEAAPFRRDQSSAGQAFVEARDTFRHQSRVSNSRIGRARASLDYKQGALERNLAGLLKKEAELQRLQEKLDAYLARAIAKIERIETVDAVVRFEPGLASKLADMNKAISGQLKAMNETMAAHKKASDRIAELTESVEKKSRRVAGMAGLSYVSQALAQAGVQIADSVYEGRKGKSVGFVAVAFSQIVANVLSPPEFYDVKFDRRTGKVKPAREFDVKKAAEQIAKSIFTTQARTFGEFETLKRLADGADNFQKFKKIAGFRRKFAGKLRRVAATKSGGRAGGFSMIKDIILEQSTEAAKGKIAEAMQSKSVQDFWAAQYALADTLKLRGRLSDLIDFDNDLYRRMVAERNAHMEGKGSRSPTGTEWKPDIVVERNDEFTPKGNYTFSIIFKNPDASRDLDFDVFVADQKLRSSTNHAVFHLTGAQATYLNDNEGRLPGKLPLRLVFR